ncbi:mechanosensitive ion channel family protein [bacterium CPR1]|nr:mechanosensitive ion channel family protein [bacterium CPR1]
MRLLLRALGVYLLIGLSALSLAQPPSPTPQGTPDGDPVPTPVDAAGLRAANEVPPQAVVQLDGLPVLTVGPTDSLDASARAQELQAELQELIDADFPGEPSIKIQRDDKDLSEVVVQGKVHIPILDSDLVANGQTREQLGQSWLKALRTSFKLAAAERAEGHLIWLLKWLAMAALLAVAVDLASVWAFRRFLRLPGWSPRFVIWTSFLALALTSFPRTRPAGLWVTSKVVIPLLWLAMVIMLTYLALGVGRRTLRYYFAAMERYNESNPASGPRWRQQLMMYHQLARIAVGLVVILAAVLIFFGALGVDLWAIVTGAGFATAAVGLAAQDMLKDWVAGINIVLEDQFGVGDLIRIQGAEGRVEAFTMRVTRIRDVEGSLITIPNSTLRMVSNLSNTWSQVDLQIPVSYNADIRRTLEVVEQEAQKLLADWPDKVAEPPEVLGLDQLGESSLVVRMMVRTFPLMQFPVRRELLLRIKERFDREGIEIPYPQRVVWLRQMNTGDEEPGGEGG